MSRKLHNYETAQTLRTASQFVKAREANSRDYSAILDTMIDLGRGHWRNEETRAAAATGDALSIRQIALQDEAHALRFQAKQWFGTESYCVYARVSSRGARS